MFKGFSLGESKDSGHQLSLALDYLALNKFQKDFISSLYGWTVFKGSLTPKQRAVANKILSKARVYEACIDYPCCGHSKCRVSTFARVEQLINSGMIPVEKREEK